MKKLLAGILSMLFFVCASAQTAKWLRYSSISPDGSTIVFTYKGDLYRVASSGGTALPLTLHEAHDYMPVWSKDGRSIAFASDRYGNFDVFVIPSTGGEAKRLTYHSANEYPYDFTSDNSTVVFGSTRMDVVSNRQFPTGSQPELYSVSTNGGRVKQILSTPAEDAKFSKDGSKILYMDKKGGENVWRKHHTSSIARDIWVYDTKAGTHTKLTSFNGEDRSPVFSSDEKNMYYLSEANGSFNVYQASLSDPSKAQALTNFKTHPVRFLSSSNDGTLCFSYNGELYTKKGNSNPTKLNITILNDAKSNTDKIVPVQGGVGGLSVSPNGKEVAFVFRGEVFVTSVEGSMTKRVTNTPEQERGVSFSPDGKSLLYSSERGNSWKIFETQMVRKEEPYFFASTLLKETPVAVNEHENAQGSYSPDGREIAFVEDRNTLKIYNRATKTTRTILTDKELFATGDFGQYFTWSPDSKWMLVQYAQPGLANAEIGIISVDGKGQLMNLTENGYQDAQPKWAMNGNMMLWFSNRDGLKSYQNSGNTQYDVYAMFFTQAAWDKFKLNKDEASLAKEMEDRAAKADTTKKPAVKDTLAKFDWEGLKYRKAKLTIHSSALSDALVSKDGENLYYLTRFERGLNLWTTNLRTKETKMLAPLNANSGSMTWDKEQKYIFLLSDGKITRLDPVSNKQDVVSINSEINLNTDAERRFMFEHVWRRTRNTFYTAGYHGADWTALKNDYESYLPHIGNNYEFSEMLSEMLGELNVSHSGASYGTFNASGDATAALGLFYDQNHTGNGMKIDEVIVDGPLYKAAFNIKPGMIIEQIDGEDITPNKDLAQYLNRKAGKNTLITVFNPSDNSRKEYIIKPITTGEENGLLYRRWVRRNQEEVDRLSNGQLGYVHIPGMNDAAFRTTLEEAMGKYGNRKGLVVDTRFNSGGDLVSDLAMWLSGKSYLVNATDKRTISYEPTFRWNKPSIALANEANYSDGHCFAYGYADLKLGKLVGMPVPGTCTYAGWEGLQDNSMTWGVPGMGVKNMNGKYLENMQTEPDVKVMNEYDKIIKGKDQQLEAAVRELMKEIK
jgi:tricorn protease